MSWARADRPGAEQVEFSGPDCKGTIVVEWDEPDLVWFTVEAEHASAAAPKLELEGWWGSLDAVAQKALFLFGIQPGELRGLREAIDRVLAAEPPSGKIGRP